MYPFLLAVGSPKVTTLAAIADVSHEGVSGLIAGIAQW